MELQREAGKEDNQIKKQKPKLRNNALFDRSIENPMNKIDLKIVITRKQYLKWSFIPTFKSDKQFKRYKQRS